MRIWVKLVAGLVLGVALALLLGDSSALSILESIGNVVIHIGRFVLFPLVLLGASVGVDELRREKQTLVVFGRIGLFLVAASLLLSVFGTLSTIVLAPERIPIIIEQEVEFQTPTLVETLLRVFPKNLFRAFIEPGDYLLPVFVLGCVVGLNLNFDRLATRPAIQLFDSLNRIFYNVNAFVLEILALGMIPISAAFLLRLTGLPELELYRQLIVVLVIDTAVVVLLIYPLLIYFLAGKRNPYSWIYAGLATILTAAATGDAYLSLVSQIRLGKENFGVPRRIAAVSHPLFALFGKAGTAMVTSVSFVVVVNSYSSLGISVGETVWIMLFSLFASVLVGPFPASGVIIALSILSRSFASGYEQGYLILVPIVPLLMSFAVAIDALTGTLATLVVAKHSGAHSEIDTGDFV